MRPNRPINLVINHMYNEVHLKILVNVQGMDVRGAR